jgi:hypothetical protein
LICLSFDLNKEQVIQKNWECPWNIKPGMSDYLKYFIGNTENYEQTEFFDLDPEKFGAMYSTRDLINPRNQGVILVDRYGLMQQEVISTKVHSQSLCFGIKEKISYGGIDR